MSFEEQLLMDLKAEFTARENRRRRAGRRVFLGVAAGIAAAAAIAVPLVTGTESPAYAVSKNDDGTISVQVNEFKDADKLEQDLKKMGVTADVTYLKLKKTCAMDRGTLVGGTPKTIQEWGDSIHHKVVDVNGEKVEIQPQYIGKGQTLVMEIAESGRVPEGPRALLRFRGLLVEGQVKPCTVIDAHYEVDGKPVTTPPSAS
ncbi:hypothetical protein [Sphaerisporangium perillae]|uniref:hypothetical protein n=1 Tax=Sphaerisporangium perillae TaxID=2935860 RepID=UPI00200F2DB6|nr:hypothetical protein [Sphaerisporangium perillae]